MSSEQKRQLKRLEKREQDGWPRLVTLKDIYPFEMFLESRGWHSQIQRGPPLDDRQLSSRHGLVVCL